jgi:hypothetical protein
MLKYILILFVVVIGYFIATSDNGGATNAASNYANTMRGG